MNAKVASIVYKPEGGDPGPEDRYLRSPLRSAELVVGYGIEGDCKGGHPKRNLNIMSQEMLDALQAEGFHTRPGEMGEQVVLRGLDVGVLVAGDCLRIGDQACVEVIDQRTGCRRFERIQGRSADAAAGRMGVMAKVVAGGSIRVGDPVGLLPEPGQPNL